MNSSNLPSDNRILAGQGSALVRSESIADDRKGIIRYGLQNADDPTSDDGLLTYWRMLKRNSRGILATAIVGLSIGLAVSSLMKPVYRARTSLEVLTINQEFMNLKQASPTTTGGDSDEASEEQTQAKLLQSSSLIGRVINKMDSNNAGQIESQPNAGQPLWKAIIHPWSGKSEASRRNLLIKAASSLKVRPSARTRVLELTVESINPKLAADFANSLTQEFMAQNIEARWNATQRTSDWLRRELDDARDRLRHSEDALQNYARDSALIFTDETTNVATEKLQQLQQALSSATAQRVSSESKFDLAQNAPPETLPDVLNDPTLREIQTRIYDLRRQEAELGELFNPEYPKIKQLQAEVQSLERSLAQSRSDVLSRISNDFRESQQRERLLKAEYNSQAHEVSGQDEKAIQYTILKRDVDSNRQLYDTMLQQMKQASVASALRASNIRIVDPAETPTSSVSPVFALNAAFGLVAGLFVSIAAVIIRESSDRTLQQPGELKAWFNMQELGTIPSGKNQGRSIRYGSESWTDSRQSLRRRTAAARSLGESPEQIELTTLQQKPSLIAEAFRSTLTSILFIGENGHRPQVLVFTSANPADGKTTVTSNIATAAAEISCKVLVIDADLRRPRLHKIFGISNEIGLTDILRGTVDLNAGNITQATNISNLYILPAGPASHAAAHLLYSTNFALLLQKLRTEYEMILIDTPPMLQMTDARVISRLADAVVLVARAGKTTKDAILAAKERFDDDRIKILGAVLNDWDPKRSPGGYYGYYRNGYQDYNDYYNPRDKPERIIAS